MNNQLVLGDSLDILCTLNPGSFDMVLTDPPYGVTNCAWDKKVDLFVLMDHLLRLVKSSGVVAITATQPFATDVINAARKYFRYDLIWEKSIATGHFNARKMPLRNHEHILIFYKSLPVFNPQKTMAKKTISRKINLGLRQKTSVYGNGERKSEHYWNETGFRLPASVLSFPSIGKTNRERFHPTQKPVELFEWLVKSYTNPGDIVFDPFAGSGTTAESCMRTGRNYFLVEKDDKYFELIKARINSVIRNGYQQNLEFVKEKP